MDPGLGDWQPPGDYKRKNAVLLNNVYLSYILNFASEIATILGETADATAFATGSKTVGAACHAKWFNTTSSCYTSEGPEGEQGDQILPLLAGATPPASVNSVLDYLTNTITVTNTGHLDTGLLNTYYLAKLLSTPQGSPAVRHDKLLLEMTMNPTFPSYADLIKKGATISVYSGRGFTGSRNPEWIRGMVLPRAIRCQGRSGRTRLLTVRYQAGLRRGPRLGQWHHLFSDGGYRDELGGGRSSDQPERHHPRQHPCSRLDPG